MRRTVISLLPIFILTVSCGGTVVSESLHEDEDASSAADAGASSSADTGTPPNELADASPDASAVPDPTGSSCPSTIAAFCAQPGVQCSDTWAAASASNPSCTQGAYDLVFFSGPCGGYDLAGTLYWENVQTYFVYDDATGALVGITSTTGTESQGGIHVLCSVGIPLPSTDASCPGSSCL